MSKIPTPPHLLDLAEHAAGEDGIILDDYAGLLGPVVVRTSIGCGHIENGISIQTTQRHMNRLVIVGGVISRDDAKRLHEWLGKTLYPD